MDGLLISVAMASLGGGNFGGDDGDDACVAFAPRTAVLSEVELEALPSLIFAATTLGPLTGCMCGEELSCRVGSLALDGITSALDVTALGIDLALLIAIPPRPVLILLPLLLLLLLFSSSCLVFGTRCTARRGTGMGWSVMKPRRVRCGSMADRVEARGIGEDDIDDADGAVTVTPGGGPDGDGLAMTSGTLAFL